MCALADQLRNILPDDLPVVDKAARVKAASQDANWFSPPLRAELREKSAECVVRPQCEEHVVAVARACVQLGAPLTPRGAGTGNYGQAVPLTGGVVIDLSGLDTFELLEPGTCRVGAGLNMAPQVQGRLRSGRHCQERYQALVSLCVYYLLFIVPADGGEAPQARIERLATHYLLLTTYYPLLTTHY